MLSSFIFLLLLLLITTASAVDFLINSFTTNSTPSLNLTADARLELPVIRLTTDSNQFSLGRAFYPSPLPFKPTNNSTNITTTFSTQFVFSVLPEIPTSPGFGIAFVLSYTTEPPNALAGQYFGMFSSSTNPPPASILAIEFDTGRNPELGDPDANHVGIDLNNIESTVTASAGYYPDGNDTLVPVNMRTGQNIHVWIEFNGPRNQVNVTLAPAGIARPLRPLLSYSSPVIANYVSSDMFVGFSASKTTSQATWVEAQRLLAWSFSDVGVARDINTTGLPVFSLPSESSGLSPGVVVGIVIGCVVVVMAVALFVYYWFWWRRRMDEDEVEDWELEYWPHRFSYEELNKATDGFSKERVLGAGGFGKVYKGVLSNSSEVGVKCVNHDSKQGLKEFMAEISSMGRLQHKNLVPMRGWCRKGNVLMLVYDYMPNGSLNSWIFENVENPLHWEGRRRVLADVAEGLNYLHNGWEKVVVHRDIKSSNVLLDIDMRGRLGDFGLAKLYSHGEVPNTTRVVGTLGYLAPEIATLATPTSASDVYSFGVVVLEVVCGRRPIQTALVDEEEEVLIDWVRKKYRDERLWEAADKRINKEYEVEEVEALLKLGLACCHPDPDRRPNMRDVVAMLIGQDITPEPKTLLSRLASADIDSDREVSNGGNNKGEEILPLQMPV